MTTRQPPIGPVEAGNWPSTLAAHAATEAGHVRVHGYSLLEDLARHYDFAETALILLGAPPPPPELGRAVNLALIVLSATSVQDAPIHAATLSRRCGAAPRAALAVGLLGLTEQASEQLDVKGTPSAETNASELWALLPRAVQEALGSPSSDEQQTALAVLRHAGLKSRTQLLAAVCMVRLPIMAAEINAIRPGGLRDYPMQVPDYVYEESK